MASAAQPKDVRPAPMRHAISGNGLIGKVRPAIWWRLFGCAAGPVSWVCCMALLLVTEIAPALQPLLKDALEVVEVRSDGPTRYTIKPLEDSLPFDKVCVKL